MRKATVTAPLEAAEELRARFLELAAEGFEDAEDGETVALTAYGEGADRVAAAFPDALLGEVEDGWEDRWREFHHGVAVGPLWIGPPWETPPAGLAAIVIDPGRAFGTGAHPTTRLCLELLVERPRGSVLDLGCGSGVLSIAAAKLGFQPVEAVDIDPVAVEVAAENAAANGVSIETRTADAHVPQPFDGDGSLANILLPDVLALAPHLRTGWAITSGYLATDALELPGYRRAERRELDGWAADLFERC